MEKGLRWCRRIGLLVCLHVCQPGGLCLVQFNTLKSEMPAHPQVTTYSRSLAERPFRVINDYQDTRRAKMLIAKWPRKNQRYIEEYK